MKKTVFFLLVALCSLQNFAAKKFYPATLIKVDGEKIECLVQEFRSKDKKLKYKESPKAKLVTVKCAEFTRMIVHFDDGDAIFDYMKYISYNNFIRGKNKVSKDQQWMQLLISGTCSLYVFKYAYGDINMYACQKQDDVPHVVGPKVFHVVFFDPLPKAISNYFSDYPELAEKIKENKYPVKDIEEIVNEYNLEKSIKK
ncbi:MAG: hypothetical protein LBH32_04920 [Dysgonamonadaceae bacterium]|jgi:hypothetical protein|nr:hypothetical protein [Dysgonamonadaceae bacterium]